MNNEERKVLLRRLRSVAMKVDDIVAELEINCPHEVVRNDESAECAICDHDFGWWCDWSPDNACHYFSNGDGTLTLIGGKRISVRPTRDGKPETEDECMFCGLPEERK